MDQNSLTQALRATAWRVRWVDEVDSTNRVLVDEARAGRLGPDVLIADVQTAGRGRRDRSWTASAGTGLLMSVSLSPGAGQWSSAPATAVSLAALDAIRDVAGLKANLKWPNDIVVMSTDGPDRKLGGVLAEAVAVDGEIVRVVVGIGINVGWPDPPADITDGVASIESEVGQRVDRSDLAEALLVSLEGWIKRMDLDAVGFGDDYRLACCTVGRDVRVELPDETVLGRAIDVEQDGRLVVEVEGQQRSFSAGDVVHLRRSASGTGDDSGS